MLNGGSRYPQVLALSVSLFSSESGICGDGDGDSDSDLRIDSGSGSGGCGNDSVIVAVTDRPSVGNRIQALDYANL